MKIHKFNFKFLKLPLIIGASAFLIHAQANEISIGGTGKEIPLGSGWNSESETGMGECVSPGKPNVSGHIGKTSLTLQSDDSVISEKLGLQLNTRARIGVLDYSVASQFQKESMSSGYSLSFNYISEISQSKELTREAENSYKINSGFEDFLKDGASWKEYCGDQVVYKVEEGAKLLVNIRVDFSTQQELSKFQANLGISGPLFQANVNAETSKSQYNKNSKFVVNLLQIGGNPEKLGQIFCPKKVDKAGKLEDAQCYDNARTTVECTFGDMQKCMNVMANAIAYASGNDPEQFSGQLSNSSNGYSTQKLYTKNWRLLGGTTFPRLPIQEEATNTKEQRQYLLDLFEETFGNFIHAQRISKHQGPRLSPRQEELMNITASHLRMNLNYLAEAIGSCYDSPASCTNEITKVEAKIGIHPEKDNTEPSSLAKEYINRKKIDELTLPETYAQFCDLGQKLEPQDPLYQTIFVMNEVAKLKMYETQFPQSNSKEDQKIDHAKMDELWNQSTDPCATAQSVLTGSPEFLVDSRLNEYLKSMKIKDFSPLLTLYQLNSIDLNNQGITTIPDLSKLQNIRKLNLSNNNISNIDHLKKIEKLEILFIQNNKITDFDPLKLLNNLRQLRNNNNPGLLFKDGIFGNYSIKKIPTSENIYKNAIHGMQTLVDTFGRVAFLGGISEGESQIGGAYFFQLPSWTIPNSSHLAPIQDRAFHTVTLLENGNILIAGGVNYQGIPLKKWEILSPSLNVLASGEMVLPRAGHTATLLDDGTVLLAGGDLLSGNKKIQAGNSFEIFNPKTGKTENLLRLDLPRSFHTATLSKNKKQLILIGGRADSESIRNIEVIDLKTFKINTISGLTLTIGRSLHTATALNDGKILITGGFQTFDQDEMTFINATSTTEIIDIENLTKSKGPDLGDQRGAHASSFIDQGKLAITGGCESLSYKFWSRGESEKIDETCTNISLILDFDKNSVSKIQPITQPRVLHQMINLKEHELLILGGAGLDSQSIELIKQN